MNDLRSKAVSVSKQVMGSLGFDPEKFTYAVSIRGKTSESSEVVQVSVIDRGATCGHVCFADGQACEGGKYYPCM